MDNETTHVVGMAEAVSITGHLGMGLAEALPGRVEQTLGAGPRLLIIPSFLFRFPHSSFLLLPFSVACLSFICFNVFFLSSYLFCSRLSRLAPSPGVAKNSVMPAKPGTTPVLFLLFVVPLLPVHMFFIVLFSGM